MHSISPLTPTVFLERAGRAFPRAPAIRQGGRELTFGDMLRRSRQLADALRERKVECRGAVGLLSENSIESVEAHFGIPGAGGVIVNLNPWLPTSDIVAQLRAVAARVVIVSRACFLMHGWDALSENGARSIILVGSRPFDLARNVTEYEHALDTARWNEPLDRAVRTEMDPLVINFTSGTTGKPKGVLLSHRAGYLHALGQVLMMSLTRRSRYLWTLPMFLVNGWGHMWANVAIGAHQLVEELPKPSINEEVQFVTLLRAARVTHLAGSPHLVRRLVGLEGAAAALRGCTVVTGGAAPSPSLLKQAEALGLNLIHQYGLSETFGPFVVCEEQAYWAHEDVEDRAALRARQGVPAVHAGTGLRVVTPDGEDVPADGKTAGEVVMSGNTVAIGYYGAQEATQRAFIDGWFHSGDLAVVHPDGYIEVRDRIKDLIHVETGYGWENISSIEVENVLSECPGVVDAALVGVHSRGADQPVELVAVVEPGPTTPSIDRLRAFCEQRLPSLMRPSHFVVAHIPKTATGKTRKDLVADLARRELAGTVQEQARVLRQSA